ESSTVVDGITINLKARWRFVEYTLKSRLRKSEIVIGAALGANLLLIAGFVSA
ncbi:hypothetical protein A2U01_0076211, partial [Trifolium medium]|nr:hypothetical protein [Trifolium medium]